MTFANRLANLVTPGVLENGPQPQWNTFSREWPYNQTSELSSSPLSGRRFPKATRYNVHKEYSKPVGWIARTAEGKFVVAEGREDDKGFMHVSSAHAHNFTPSNYPGARGSLRSDGSGQSTFHQDVFTSSRFQKPFLASNLFRARQVTFNHASHMLPTVYSPVDSRFRTSSPGPIAAAPFQVEELSSVNLPSSAERSFPSTVSSHFASLQHTPSYELPSLRALHDPYLKDSGNRFRPIPGAQPTVDAHPTVRPLLIGNQTLHRPQMRGRPTAFGEGRTVQTLSGRQYTSVGPRSDLPGIQPSSSYMEESMQGDLYSDYHSVIPVGVDQQRPLATSSPPWHERRVARVLPSSTKSSNVANDSFPQSTERDGSDTTSSDNPMTYTRERLLGAVERVRSGALHRRGHHHHSEPEVEVKTIIPATSPSISPTIEDRFSSSLPAVGHQIDSGEQDADTTYLSDEGLHTLDGRITVIPQSRASIVSGSSGRGSKEASVVHSRGDSLQGELDAANRSGSSSGFASRNISNVQSSTSPGSGSSSGPMPYSSRFFAPVLGNEGGPDSPHSEPSYPLSRLGRRVGMDDSYEGTSPLDSGLLDQLRRYSGHQVRPTGSTTDKGLSDSELYTDLYPKPKRKSKYDNTEARCAALKEEFLQFRRRQQERRRSDKLESAC